MSKHSTHRALNRLLTVVERSLPSYLHYARPWTHAGDEAAVTALARIVQHQQQMAERIGAAILDIGPIDLGEYPIEFYDLHDLSLDFLLGRLVHYQKGDVARAQQIVSELQHDRAAAALAEEALGMFRGQLETLEELPREPARPAA